VLPLVGVLAAGLSSAQSDSKALRTETLARLWEELDAASGSSWTIVAGCPQIPKIPATMAGISARLFVATENRIECYDVDAGAWEDASILLPERVGEGVALVGDGADTLFIAAGGDRRKVWALSIADRRLGELPEPMLRVGRGGALAWAGGELYLAPGQRQRDLLRFGRARAWESLEQIGGVDVKVETSFGRSSGFLARLGPAIYAWPDHHMQRFDWQQEDWGGGTWLAMGFRPSLDGGGVAGDDEVGSIYVACGKYSRSLNEIVSMKRQKRFYYLRPRLPYPMIGDGDRVAIARKDGVPHLFVYAVEPDNKLCHLPCSRLTRLTPDDDVADQGSRWHRLHSSGGGSGVRRRKDLGAHIDLERARGTLAAMGALGDELFFMRLANVRRVDPRTGDSTYYPGYNVGRPLAIGAAATYDGERFVYLCPGGSTDFLRWDVPTGPLVRKGPTPRRPVDETDLESLPPMPAEVGRGAALSHHGGMVYAMPAGGTRDLWRYEIEAKRWQSLSPLPPAAAAMGDRGTGLVAVASGVYAIPDEHVWRYDTGEDRWEPFAELPFLLDWDGGMVTNDGERHLYVVRGDVSTRFGRLDLETRRFEELLPRPPDAISAEGNRLAVLTVDDERRLYVHRGHNSNEILWIRLADLEPLGD